MISIGLTPQNLLAGYKTLFLKMTEKKYIKEKILCQTKSHTANDLTGRCFFDKILATNAGVVKWQTRTVQSRMPFGA